MLGAGHVRHWGDPGDLREGDDELRITGRHVHVPYAVGVRAQRANAGIVVRDVAVAGPRAVDAREVQRDGLRAVLADGVHGHGQLARLGPR